MTASKLRAVATALSSRHCHGLRRLPWSSLRPRPAAVRAAVGKPLQEAQELAAAGNYKAAMAKVNEAEAVSGKTAEETKIIAQMKDYHRRQVRRHFDPRGRQGEIRQRL